MNDRYMLELRHQMRCSRKTQNRLLEQFIAYQQNSLDETPDYDRMVTMFGPPDEMARVLMEEVTSEERCTYVRNKLILKIIAIVLAVLFVVFSLYIMLLKELTVVEFDEYTYVSELYNESEETELVP